MRIGFTGGSYVSRSTAVSAEEAINFYLETVMAQGSVVPSKAYGGQNAQSIRSLFGTPGLKEFATFPAGPVRGSIPANGRYFVVSGPELYEINASGGFTAWGAIANDGQRVSMAFNSVQLLIVGGGHAYCFTLATNTLLDVTDLLLGTPMKCDGGAGYFAVCFQNSPLWQLSQLLDGTTWPQTLNQQVQNFPENIVSIAFNHLELWIYGQYHTQPYQNTGSTEAYDPIYGSLIEKGIISTFAPARLDNSIFWIDQDENGSCMAWRSNGYTPSRVSTYAVETDLNSYSATQLAGIVTYAYTDGGHEFWMVYIPGAPWSWCYDVNESLWHKRTAGGAVNTPHPSWDHLPAFGKHLVCDWNSANLWAMSMSYYDFNGTPIIRTRISPTVSNEMKWITMDDLTIDFDTGLGPQPPLTDGGGNARDPQAMLYISRNRGKTYGAQHIMNCGQSGNYTTRAFLKRLGHARYPVFKLQVSDPIPWVIVDAYLNSNGQ